MKELTDTAVRKVKGTEKPQKLSDGGGLFLLVEPNGGKYWRLAYRFVGKQKTLALGVYPDVSLADARSRREDARKLLVNDTDPGAVKQAQKAAQTALTEKQFRACRPRVVCAPFAQLERKPFKQDHRQTGKRCIPVDRCAAYWRDCRARIAGSDTPNREPWRIGNRTPRPCLLRASVSLCRGNRTR